MRAYSLGHSCNVVDPGQIVSDIYPEELEDLDHLLFDANDAV